MIARVRAFGFVACCVIGTAAVAEAEAKTVRPRHAGHRALTITARPARGLYVRGTDTLAIGGFGANGYGTRVATPEERREAQNAGLRQAATGFYGDGADGLGGAGFGDRETGDRNPYWGQVSNRYVGFDGTPTILAFGPGFANRHATEHDPEDDEEPGPTPADLGFESDGD